MSKLLKTQALVLKKKEILGKDVIVSLLTQDSGKMVVIAKGIKKLTSRRAPHLQTGNLIEVILYREKEAAYLHDTKLISAFSQMKNNQQKLKYLYVFLFVIDRLLPENQQESIVYSLSKSFMVNLTKSPIFSLDNLVTYFNQLLKELGYSHKPTSFTQIVQSIEEIIDEKVPVDGI